MKIVTLTCSLVLVILAATCAAAFTKDKVIKRDHVLCGVSTGVPGFSSVDGEGNWRGLDVDVCRAVAAAVLNDSQKVKFVPLLPKERATALLSGEIDILARNLTWNLTRDSAQNMNFATITFYDLQGFLVTKRLEVESLLDLKNFTVCLQSGAQLEQNLADFLHESSLKYKTVISDTPDQILKDFQAGTCDVITGGRAQLQGLRSKMVRPGETFFLPEAFTILPLGPAVRQGDDGWFDIVKWSVFAMIYGEELGLTMSNIDEMVTSTNGKIQRFLGLEGVGGKGLGLSDGWAYHIVKQVGNYGESFERNLGQSSPLKLKRGLNNLWNDGGILYAPEIR